MCLLLFGDVLLFLAFSFFFFNDTATTEIYTLSLHDALPIYVQDLHGTCGGGCRGDVPAAGDRAGHLRQLRQRAPRSEEHTSELQSRLHLVCRLLLEKKKKKALPAHFDAYAIDRL